MSAPKLTYHAHIVYVIVFVTAESSPVLSTYQILGALNSFC